MDNCLFVANLPQNLNNYELTISLYLVFSRYGKIIVVKASRDVAHRPFGFVEFSCNNAGITSCREAMYDNERCGGIIIGGRKVRLELAKNTAKLIVKMPRGEGQEDCMQILRSELTLTTQFPHNNSNGVEGMRNTKIVPLPKEKAFLVKLDPSEDPTYTFRKLKDLHPDWSIDFLNDEITSNSGCINGVVESIQRQSGLFQLLIPSNGVLPVSPTTMAKIHSTSPSLQYSLAPLETNYTHYHQQQSKTLNGEVMPSQTVMNRLYEDWHAPNHQESFVNPLEARAAASRLNPPLGDWDGDVFLGRLDNQNVTISTLIERASAHGQVTFVRLCNRGIIREDKVPVDSTAFVRFGSEEEAQKCIKAENGATWMGRIIKCEKCWNFPGRATPPMSLDSAANSMK